MEKIEKIALLGGGQLGKMFLQEAMNFPVPVAVLDPNPNAPCAHLTSEFQVGDFNDLQTVLDFVHRSGANSVGIEIEHVSVEALEILASEGKRVIPLPSVLRLMQDKGLQKNFYQQYYLQTAPFYLIENKSELDLKKIPLPFVQKLRTGGYDGKGVQIIRNTEDLENLWDAPSVIEELCPIAKEIAVIVALDDQGEIEMYPTMEMVFDPQLNLVDYVQMPANITLAEEIAAQQMAKDVVLALGSVGIFAVEMFVTTEGEVWINETAPRVHNSGHVTIEACSHSQFAQMWRLLAGMPLGSIRQNRIAAMVNLIGAEGHAGLAELEGLEKVLDEGEIFPHWYGKTETHPGRKMGHVTILGQDEQALQRKAKRVKKALQVISKS